MRKEQENVFWKTIKAFKDLGILILPVKLKKKTMMEIFSL